MIGVHGLATTFGRIPVNDMSPSTMIKSGPLAASAIDVALTYAAISSNELTSFYSELYDGGNKGPPQPTLFNLYKITNLSDIRIGLYKSWFHDSDKDIYNHCYKVIKYLQSKGASVIDIEIPHIRIMRLAHSMRISTEFSVSWDKHYHSYPNRLVK